MNSIYVVMLGEIGSTDKWIGSVFFKSYEQAEKYITTEGNFSHVDANYYEEVDGTTITTACILELGALED